MDELLKYQQYNQELLIITGGACVVFIVVYLIWLYRQL